MEILVVEAGARNDGSTSAVRGLNEMLESDLVLLSRGDEKADSSGAVVLLSEGLAVYVYMDDPDEEGSPGALIADGVVEAYASGPVGAGCKMVLPH